MLQAKFSLEQSHIEFLNKCKEYGFQDKSEMVRKAIERLRTELELETLQKSAELYAELYEQDNELQQLTESALVEWPQ